MASPPFLRSRVVFLTPVGSRAVTVVGCVGVKCPQRSSSQISQLHCRQGSGVVYEILEAVGNDAKAWGGFNRALGFHWITIFFVVFLQYGTDLAVVFNKVRNSNEKQCADIIYLP